MPNVRSGPEQAATEGHHLAETASEHGQEVMATASGQAREVTGTVRKQANELTSELSSQGRDLYWETRQQIEDQAQTQSEVLAQALRRWGTEADALVDGRPEQAGAVGECVRQCATKLHDLASGIELRGAPGLVDELQDFGRRRPGAFLLGAALVGFGGARLVRSGSAGDAERSEAESAEATSRVNGPSSSRTRSSGSSGASRQLASASSGGRRNPPASGGE